MTIKSLGRNKTQKTKQKKKVERKTNQKYIYNNNKKVRKNIQENDER